MRGTISRCATSLLAVVSSTAHRYTVRNPHQVTRGLMMIRTMMLIPMVVALLACGLITSANDPTEESERNVEVFGDQPVEHYGDASIEEKILNSDPIVKATLTSFSSEVVVDAKGKFRPALKFSLDVSEYLKGSGPSSIVAVWLDGRRYDTNDVAEDAEAVNLSVRDDQWDDREAVIFMFDGGSGFGTRLTELFQRADHFPLALGHRYLRDDRYTLHSDRYKAWHPAASSTGSTGDDQEFLLDVPSAPGSGSTAPTITLGDLKTRIAEVTSELAGGDGSEAYRECVRIKHEFERRYRYFQESLGRDLYDKSPQDSVLASGQPAGTILHERNWYGTYPDTKARTWIEGTDAARFSVMQGETTPNDSNRDGVLTAGVDEIRYMEKFLVDRPLPGGEYEIDRKEVWIDFLVCDYVVSHEWTVTVESPEGTLHEAFFDPVTDGTAVAADGTNGVLKPASFTGTDDASATIERIEWESGTVELEVSPHTVVAGHAVDFIELDGSVSLSLHADDATVDAANDTLSWSVASQPWEDGDELMVRVRKTRSNGAAVPDRSNNSADIVGTTANYQSR